MNLYTRMLHNTLADLHRHLIVRRTSRFTDLAPCYDDTVFHIAVCGFIRAILSFVDGNLGAHLKETVHDVPRYLQRNLFGSKNQEGHTSHDPTQVTHKDLQCMRQLRVDIHPREANQIGARHLSQLSQSVCAFRATEK